MLCRSCPYEDAAMQTGKPSVAVRTVPSCQYSAGNLDPFRVGWLHRRDVFCWPSPPTRDRGL